MTDNNNLDDIEEDFADFDDDGFEDGGEDFAEGDEFVEEEWDSFDQDGEMMADEPAGKKKSSLMFNLIIGLVALGGAGFVGMKFMGGGTPQQAAQQQMTGNDMSGLPGADGQMPMPAGNNMADSGAASKPTPAATPTQTASNDFTPPPSDPELDFDMPMPFSNQDPADSAQAPTAPKAESDDAFGAMASASDDAVAAPAPAGFDSEPLTPLPGAEAEVDKGPSDFDLAGNDGGSDVSGGMLSSAKPTMSGGDDQAVISAVESKIDQLFNRLDDIEARLEKSGAGQAYDDSALRASIAKLEKKVNSLSSRASSGAGVSSRSAAPAQTRAKPVVSPRETPVAKTETWILTSAQPGKATIKKVGQDDVIWIAVGDRVSGLGEVQSIRLVDGKWVVSATGGKIIQ